MIPTPYNDRIREEFRQFNHCGSLLEIENFFLSKWDEKIAEVEKGFETFLLKDWSGEAEVEAEIERLKSNILNILKN